MKFIVFTAIFFVSLSLIGCGNSADIANQNISNDTAVNTNANSAPALGYTNINSEPLPKQLKIALKANPQIFEANKPNELVFTMKDDANVQIKNYKTVHEKKMHLFAVSSDLSELEHLHPALQSDGSFKIRYAFKHGGKYILYADATPENGSQVLERIEINVKGTELPAEELIIDNNFTKSIDGISVTMKPDGELVSNKETSLNFIITNVSTGQGVTDLRPYLGELAHIVIISEDTKNFLHIHPVSNKTASVTSVAAQTNFPTGGIYKMWVQFQRNNKIINIPYVVNVTKGNEKIESNTKIENGIIKIKVGGYGFSPSSISVKKGEPVKLIFFREAGDNCGDEVVFPTLNIKQKLPVGNEVEVEINPTETGEINFSCGLNIMKGKIVVE